MQKTIYSPEHKLFLALLKEQREGQGITQSDLALRLDWEQTLISRTERGARRLDLMELRSWLAALGVDLGWFVAELEDRIRRNSPPEGRRTRKPK